MAYIVINHTTDCILGIFEIEYNAKFLKKYYQEQGVIVDIVKIFDDNTIKGLIMTENLKRRRNNE